MGINWNILQPTPKPQVMGTIAPSGGGGGGGDPIGSLLAGLSSAQDMAYKNKQMESIDQNIAASKLGMDATRQQMEGNQIDIDQKRITFEHEQAKTQAFQQGGLEAYKATLKPEETQAWTRGEAELAETRAKTSQALAQTKGFEENAKKAGLENAQLTDIMIGNLYGAASTGQTLEEKQAIYNHKVSMLPESVRKTLPPTYSEEAAHVATISGAEAQRQALEQHQKTARAQTPFQQQNTLRDEYNKQSQPFMQVSDSYGRIISAGKDPSAAGDLALIFNYMKMLDPGSTVREGEFATAQNSASIPEIVRAKYNQVINGERLADKQRADFLDRSGKLYQSQREGHKKIKDNYKKLAERAGLDPQDVVIDYDVKTREDEANKTNSTQTQSTNPLSKYYK